MILLALFFSNTISIFFYLVSPSFENRLTLRQTGQHPHGGIPAPYGQEILGHSSGMQVTAGQKISSVVDLESYG